MTVFMRLLLAEDEMELSKALCAILKHHNYSVDAVYNGNDALDYCLSGEYDGAILDVMMPGLSGMEVVTKLREQGVAVPVLMLTAKAQIDDRIAGLDAGADDYLTKPFDMGELLARIRAMTRRKEEFLPNTLKCGNLHLNRITYMLTCGDIEIRLGGREYQIIEMLMENPRRYIATEQFMEHIWGSNSDAELGGVWVYISNLRKKITALGASAEIKAVRGVGYTLEECR